MMATNVIILHKKERINKYKKYVYMSYYIKIIMFSLMSKKFLLFKIIFNSQPIRHTSISWKYNL